MFKKITYLLRDIKNLTIYGLNGPRALELLYVDPAIITSIQNERFYKSKDAGRVIKGRCLSTKMSPPLSYAALTDGGLSACKSFGGFSQTLSAVYSSQGGPRFQMMRDLAST